MGEPKVESQNESRKVIDVNTETSSIPGIGGVFESFLRRFRNLSLFCCFPLSHLCAVPVSDSLPLRLWRGSISLPDLRRGAGDASLCAGGFGLASGFMVYGLSLIFVVPAVNFILPLKVKPFRGPWYSLSAIPWYVHNGLTYMVRYTFLEFVTPSPLNVLFYRMMGMKLAAEL